MKCIGEECPYFHPDEYYGVARGYCASHDMSYQPYENHDCTIKEDITREEQELYKKKQVAEWMKNEYICKS